MRFELTDKEKYFILLLRNFDFLRSINYSPKEFSLYGRETFLIYEHQKIKQEVFIEWAPKNHLELRIIKKSIFKGGEFDLKSVFKHFESDHLYASPPIYVGMPEVIEYNAKFIQQHLMPVLKGVMWIDKLIELNKKDKSVK